MECSLSCCLTRWGLYGMFIVTFNQTGFVCNVHFHVMFIVILSDQAELLLVLVLSDQLGLVIKCLWSYLTRQDLYVIPMFVVVQQDGICR